MCAEMNGFTINNDLWFIQIFAFKNLGDLEDLDWLADFDYYSDEIMVLSGMEDLQAIFKKYMDQESWNDPILESACTLTELIIIVRLQELFKEVRNIAMSQNLTWNKIPLFSTAHDSDIVYTTHR